MNETLKWTKTMWLQKRTVSLIFAHSFILFKEECTLPLVELMLFLCFWKKYFMFIQAAFIWSKTLQYKIYC